MKGKLRQQIDDLLPGKKGLENFISDCISLGICPHCENKLYASVVDKYHEKIVSFGCTQCEYKNHIQVKTKSADRHGLV